MANPFQSLNITDLKKLLRKELKQYLSFDEPIVAELDEMRVLRDQLETQSQPKALFARRLALNTIFKEIVDEIYKEEKELALILRRRFFEKATIRQVADEFHLGEATVSRRQEEALDKLADHFLIEETRAREAWFHRLEVYLPAQPYTKLVGVDTLLENLYQQIVASDGSDIVTLFGIGGIGKSSLADAILRRGLRSGLYNRVAWVYFDQDNLRGSSEGDRAPEERFVSLLAQQLMPKAGPLSIQTQMERLHARLKMDPHLIVIDNLEKKDETNLILKFLNGWAGVSRFIITTRVQPDQMIGYVQNLTELNKADSFELLRYLLSSSGLDPSNSVDSSLLEKIYQVAGGNPFALKIIVGLLRKLPLDQILSELEQGKGNAMLIYRQIFMKTWHILSESAQILLQSMPLTGANAGATPNQMMAACGLANDPFWLAIDELTSHSMLEVRGSLNDRRYGIHQLTESFISSEIIGLDDRW